jgi:hypothetical protein
MAKNKNEVWHEGFTAGAFFSSRCPYPEQSKDADAWEAGWAEGTLMRTGGDYCSEPPPSGWQKLLQWLRSP